MQLKVTWSMYNQQNNSQSYDNYTENSVFNEWEESLQESVSNEWEESLQEFETKESNGNNGDNSHGNNAELKATEESYSDNSNEDLSEENNESHDEIMERDFEDSTIYKPSNAGTPIENPNIQVDVEDGNDIEKLEFSSQYTNPNGDGNDWLSGTKGANTFDVNLLINAKPEIYQKHIDGNGKIDWQGVAGENNNYHDHWVDGIGQDTISDFSGSGGEGDKINVVGHTVAVTVLEESDRQIKLGLYSDQGADNSRGNGAHDFDVLGTLTIEHDGNFDYGSDVSVNPNVFDGAFEFA